MASSNVDFYQRQKELQASLHEKEQERIRLEQQLYAYFKTDKRLSKLRAAKLQSYWKRVCSDEEKSRQRNEKILRDFERIEGHLCSVSSRTEKLKMLKKQYEEQVKQKYPEWKSLIGQEKVENEVNVGPSFSEHSQDLAMEKPPHIPHSKGTPPKHSSSFLSNIGAVHDLPYDHVHKSDHGRGSGGDQITQDQNMLLGFQDSGEVTLQDLSGSGLAKKREFSHEDITSQIIEEVEDEEKLGQIEQEEEEEFKAHHFIRPPSHFLHVQQGRQHESQITDHKPSMETVAEEEDEEGTDYSDTNIPDETLPVRPPLSAHSNTRAQPPSSMHQHSIHNPPPSDGIVTGPEPPQLAVMPTSKVADLEPVPSSIERKGVELSETQTPRSLLRSDSSSIKSNSPLPDLTIEGLLYLVKCLQQEIPQADNVDSYYRCQHPPLQARKDIVRQANQSCGLGSLDGNSVSMVILEQLTLVVRELAQECLLSDSVLVKSHTFTTEKQLRAQLLRESQRLWDRLFEHFCTLLKHKVMGPQEIAAVFVPGLVADKSANQDKAFSLIVRLLEKSTEEEEEDPVDDLSSVTFSAHANILLPNSPNSPQKPAPAPGVPPLSLGSMADKQTDEESDFFDQSLPKDPVPLNETAAYRNMLSGTFSSGLPTVPHREEDDTDDDVEKQFASVLSPRTPKNRPGSARSPRPAPLTGAPDPVLDDVMSEISSTSPPVSPPVQQNSNTAPKGSSHRNPALNIGSDLDSDTDVEFPMSRAKTKSKTSLDDDFDFYG